MPESAPKKTGWQAPPQGNIAGDKATSGGPNGENSPVGKGSEDPHASYGRIPEGGEGVNQAKKGGSGASKMKWSRMV